MTTDAGGPAALPDAAQRLDRYHLTERIGAGGMGVVYRARDPRLGRDVAVKVLPESFANDDGRLKRFEREARAAAALDHPNILAVHDVETSGAVPYIVTELLEGETLRERLNAGDLTPRSSVEIAAQIARGLAAAHDRGIVHRDLKPDNVFITKDGTVKLLDFGLAKLTHLEAPTPDVTGAVTEAPPTASGAVLGTIGYMAPEQVRGLQADHRADIFALGCVLYEMLSGRRAFGGTTPADTSAAILSSDPQPLSEVNPRLPSGLDPVVARCLQKRADDRFQSVRDVAFALQAISTLPPARHIVLPRRWVAVRLPLWAVLASVLVGCAVLLASWVKGRVAVPPLPAVKHTGVVTFEAVDQSGGLSTIAAGLSELVSQGLTLIEQDQPVGSWTVPRREAAAVNAESVEDLRQKFNVNLAVTGRLQRSGERLRLELAAVDPSTLRTLRSTVVDDRISNVASFQDGLVLRVARMLGLEPSERASGRLAATTTTIPEAFLAHLELTEFLAGDGDQADLERAAAGLEAAMAKDPLYAAGRVALGWAYLKRFEATHEAGWIDRAVAVANGLLTNGGWPEEAHRLIAAARLADGRPAEAVAELETAARIAPARSEVQLELAAAYQADGRPDQAEHAYQRAVFLMPDYWLPHHLLAKLYFAQGSYHAAATQWRDVIACAPEFTRGYNNLGMIYILLGRFQEARQALERSLAIEPSRWALSNLGTLYFDDARFADAAAMFERALAEDDSVYKAWGNLGYAYRFGDSPEKAEPTFRRAVELAEAATVQSPGDLQVATDLADYYAMLGNRERGLQVIKPVIEATPDDPTLIADVAECLWDLGDHARALEWVRRAFDAGAPRRRFESRPTLRDLVADGRYQQLVANLDRRP